MLTSYIFTWITVISIIEYIIKLLPVGFLGLGVAHFCMVGPFNLGSAL